MSDFVVEAYRFAEDAAQVSSCLEANNPYQCNLVQVVNDQISAIDDTPGVAVRTSTRITVAAMFGDGYLSYAPGDGYLNPYATDMRGNTPILSAQALGEMEWMLGPLVFPYTLNGTNGGTDPNIFFPLIGSNNNIQIYIQLLGPGFNPNNGVFFKAQEVVLGKGDNIYYHIRMISTGEVI